MSGLFQQLRDYGQWANSVSDPRTKDWFLMSSPRITYSLVALYLVLVYYGPRFMAPRKALDLKLPMLVYNFALVVLSAFMFKEFFVTTVLNPKFSVSCQSVDYSDDPLSVRLAGACWWFFFSKIIELLDTVIFILRKKNNQISFLHVYHHATMPFLWWIGVRWVAGGASFFSGMVNCFIHVLMYGYYFLSALGPWIQPYLWWKRYLTSLQLLQFFTVLIHCMFVMYQQCGFPNGYVWALIAYLISHILLFSNFYIQAYVVKAKKGKSKKSNGHVENDVPSTPGGNGRYNLRERSPRTPYTK
ncbi:very long chain fatty acid elongase 4-like [Lytechinus pictus]|uniref:very long chain fatty acid elongase 4-like n=1 Tax=Lytechinus pictus TaxID=7653 RepID=UPI00240D8C26|nr:elongation of very long chain fatty acids protein 4-like [Lytechinus pictus]